MKHSNLLNDKYSFLFSTKLNSSCCLIFATKLSKELHPVTSDWPILVFYSAYKTSLTPIRCKFAFIQNLFLFFKSYWLIQFNSEPLQMIQRH